MHRSATTQGSITRALRVAAWRVVGWMSLLFVAVVAMLAGPLSAAEVGEETELIGPPPVNAPVEAWSDPYDPCESWQPWDWHILPDGLVYRSYLAGRESRFATVWFSEHGHGYWDSSLGGRVGLLRYGNGSAARPEGWQLDLEGAAFPRLDLKDDRRELVSADFRAGFPITYGVGPMQLKVGYYHLSSHLGDEFMLRFPKVQRINYTRDSLIWGNSFYATDDLRVYGETAWAFHRAGGAEPWEFQLGVDYSPAGPTGARGAPFFAINTHLRQENDFGGNITIETGWQWRGRLNGPLFRVGAHYLNGKSPQLEFFDDHEEQIGLGLWYDY